MAAGIYIGDRLRDAVREVIAGIGWEGDEQEAAAGLDKALKEAKPAGRGYRLDVDQLTEAQDRMLGDILDDLVEDIKNICASRGLTASRTPVGRQLIDFNERWRGQATSF